MNRELFFFREYTEYGFYPSLKFGLFNKWF